VLAAAYASTLGMDAVPGHDYSTDEGHYLLAARALVQRHNLDVAGEYRGRGAFPKRAPAGHVPPFDSVPLKPQGMVTKGIRYEPHSIGLPLLAAPFYALGGAKAVECMVAALLALALALGYLLARRVVPDPWCAFAALALGLSPPLLASGTAVLPEPVAAVALAGAALCAARLRDGPSRVAAFTCFLMLGWLPWLGIVFAPPAVVIGFSAVRSLRRAGRGLLALGSTEVAFFLLALLVGLNEALFGGPTPHAADVAGTSATGADSVSDYLGRCWRIVALFLDQNYGLIRWAPVAALIFAGVWVLYRSARERLSQAISGLDAEFGVARLCGYAALAGAVTAALFIPSLQHGGFPARALVPVLALTLPLVALGLRQSPRIGLVLSLLGVAGSVWLWIDTRSGGGLLEARPQAPWGPLVHVFPTFHGGVWPYLLLLAVLLALAAPVVRQELEVRRRLG
jgi:hypothetical protein